MKMMLQFNHDELNQFGYPVIVESWQRVQGSMSHRRKYHETFTEKERDVIARYHRIFYGWYLRTGTPESATMSVDTYNLIVRACNFFGGIN